MHFDFVLYDLAIRSIKGFSIGSLQVNFYSPFTCRFGHVASRESSFCPLGMGSGIIKYQDMIFLCVMLIQDIYDLGCLLQDLIIGKVSSSVLSSFEEDSRFLLPIG